MAFPSGAIKLEAAQAVFAGVDFRRIEVMGKAVGYSATFLGMSLEDTSLTSLCRRLWLKSNDDLVGLG